jgi:hypothetical protein
MTKQQTGLFLILLSGVMTVLRIDILPVFPFMCGLLLMVMGAMDNG